jgi:sorbitol-6-phosphate 2-dehydrogenase
MSNTLANQVALVTGGAQGLGQAICLRLANEGCDVAVADIKLEQAQATADLIVKETGRRGLAIIMDVTDEASVQAGFARTVNELGRLDILVANAGILIAGEVTEFPAEKWRAVMNVDLFGYFLAAKEAARHMKAQHSGNIIQINSKSGKKGSYKNSAYAASKFGGIGLTQSLALVRQKYIDQVPMKRGCTYEDICNVVVFLASDQSGYMTGQAINVTGGQEMR